MAGAVYLETTIFSFYHDDRSGPAIVARRGWTRQWWDQHRRHYDLVTSTVVLDELSRGKLAHKARALELAQTIPAVPVSAEVAEIVEVYIAHRLMPKDPLGDAMHLALASFYKCDFLLTWNCRNLANANKFGHIRRVHALLDLHVPTLATPLELTEDSTDEAD
jgi:hypothetical protein